MESIISIIIIFIRGQPLEDKICDTETGGQPEAICEYAMVF